MANTRSGKTDAQQKGYLLITSYAMLFVLSIFSLAIFTRSHGFIQNTERSRNRMRAFQMAEAGLDKAIASLASNSSYSGTGSYTALGSQSGYDTDVCPPSCPAGMTAPTDPKVRLVRASGFSPSNTPTDRAYEARAVESYVELDTTPFEFAAFGDTSLTLNGTPMVNSYDSRNGAYGGLNVGSSGDVSSDGPISLIGNPIVFGDLVEEPDIECSPATTSITSSGTLRINGSQDYQLAAGTYRFDSIDITGSGKLTLLGPVTIYVDGDVHIGGNGVATSGNTPSNLMVYATGSSTIEITGNGKFYGAIFAPASDVHYTGNDDFFGAVIADTYQQSGTTNMHYDVALGEMEAPCVQVSMLSWEEEGIAAAS